VLLLLTLPKSQLARATREKAKGKREKKEVFSG
jgi:hypothetical protein